ncbi:MAG: CotS family spore coat protein [Clostridium sp.]|nr:CotS family spore coat protein [Clostridium sp.]
MLDLGYIDKEYLSKYDLDVKLFKSFNIEVYDVVPSGRVYILFTDKGTKILKKIDYTIEEFKFLNEALAYIKTNFKRVSNFLETPNNKKFINWYGEYYCIMDGVEGRNCDFNNDKDIAKVANSMGEIHKASEGFGYKRKYKNKSGTLITTLKRKVEEMIFFKKIAEIYDNKREFDSIFLENIDRYIKKMNDSIEYLNDKIYYKLCSEDDKIVLCHHNLNCHNIIINDNGVYFINFENSIIDLKVHDICNFVNNVSKKVSYDFSKFNVIIDNYLTSNTLNNEEKEVLIGMLSIPEEFYILAKNYYSKRIEEPEEISALKVKKNIKEQEMKMLFIEKLKENI